MAKNNILGSRIKALRQKMGLSQLELASKLNCTQAALSQYESGNREPGLSDLKAIAERLNTTTDYLLGLTDVPQNDVNIRMIGDYLGLSDQSIKVLHTNYSKYRKKTSEEYILEDLEVFSGVSRSDPNYEVEYSFIKRDAYLDLIEYCRVLNDLICSSEFAVFIRCLKDNLYVERHVFDVLRIVMKQYSKIETPFPTTNIAEMAYSLAESDEEMIQRYALNIFDGVSALTDFSKNYTKLEGIKALEYEERFYKRILMYLYHFTRPMFVDKNYSVKLLESGVSEVIGEMLPTIEKILDSK